MGSWEGRGLAPHHTEPEPHIPVTLVRGHSGCVSLSWWRGHRGDLGPRARPLDQGDKKAPAAPFHQTAGNGFELSNHIDNKRAGPPRETVLEHPGHETLPGAPAQLLGAGLTEVLPRLWGPLTPASPLAPPKDHPRRRLSRTHQPGLMTCRQSTSQRDSPRDSECTRRTACQELGPEGV